MQLHSSDKHCRSPPTVVCRSAQKHAHPASAETSPQTAQNRATAPAWLWLPSSQGESLEADPVVWEADEDPSSVSQASASPEHEYDKSIIAVAEVPALSPRSAVPA